MVGKSKIKFYTNMAITAKARHDCKIRVSDVGVYNRTNNVLSFATIEKGTVIKLPAYREDKENGKRVIVYRSGTVLFITTEADFVYSNTNKTSLSDAEKQAIRTLNFVASHDGIIRSEEDIKYLLQEGINKFIAKKRRHLVSITQTATPIRIKY